MKILLAGLYNAYGGSTFTLLQMKKALENNFEVVLRSPIKEANEKQKCFFPNYTLNSLFKKLKVLKIFLCLLMNEFVYIKKSNFDYIMVNDNLSLFVYGIISKVLNKKLVFRVEHIENDNLLQKIKDFLVYDKIYINEFMRRNNHYFIIRNALIPFKCDKIDTNEIYIIGSIARNKNQLFGLKVFKKLLENHPYYKLIIVGNILEDDYFEELKKFIKRNHLESKVIFKDFTKKEEIYKRAKIVFITSNFETFGFTFLESLYCNIPVVAPNIEAFKELSHLLDYNHLYKQNNLINCLEIFDTILQKELGMEKIIINTFSIKEMEDNFYNYFKLKEYI